MLKQNIFYLNNYSDMQLVKKYNNKVCGIYQVKYTDYILL